MFYERTYHNERLDTISRTQSTHVHLWLRRWQCHIGTVLHCPPNLRLAPKPRELVLQTWYETLYDKVNTSANRILLWPSKYAKLHFRLGASPQTPLRTSQCSPRPSSRLEMEHLSQYPSHPTLRCRRIVSPAFVPRHCVPEFGVGRHCHQIYLCRTTPNVTHGTLMRWGLNSRQDCCETWNAILYLWDTII